MDHRFLYMAGIGPLYVDEKLISGNTDTMLTVLDDDGNRYLFVELDSAKGEDVFMQVDTYDLLLMLNNMISIGGLLKIYLYDPVEKRKKLYKSYWKAGEVRHKRLNRRSEKLFTHLIGEYYDLAYLPYIQEYKTKLAQELL